MKRFVKSLFLALLAFGPALTLCGSIEKPVSAQYGGEENCQPPLKSNGMGGCVAVAPGETATDDVVINGYLYRGASIGFGSYLYNGYVQPYYGIQANQLFKYLPSPSQIITRIRELNRRKKIHDCIASKVAGGFRENGMWAVQEVTFEYLGRRARFDIVYGALPGIPTGVVEIKTVLDYERAVDDLLVRNQKTVAEAIMRGEAIPYGNNAAYAGFQVGSPIGRPIKFTVSPFDMYNECGLG